MPGYELKQESIEVAGVAPLIIRSLLDKQQFADPLGEAAAQGISSAFWPLFGLVWPSGEQLAAAMVLRPVLAGERILEIGCGLALASLVSHRRGANITASDCHPLTRAFLQANASLNALSEVPYCHGPWLGSQLVSSHGPNVLGRFDLIIGSDVLYERDEAGVLTQFIARHAAPTGEVLIVDPNRGHRVPFHRRMAGLGYTLTETPLTGTDYHGAHYRGRLLHYRRQLEQTWYPQAVGAVHGAH
jgi:predicted nicotinamide N-methyase